MQLNEGEEWLLGALADKEAELEQGLMYACAEAEEIIEKAKLDGEKIFEEAKLELIKKANERMKFKRCELMQRRQRRLTELEAAIERLEKISPGQIDKIAQELVFEVFPELLGK